MRDGRELTGDEARWVMRLRALMQRCPPGLELYATGDRCLTVIDCALADGDLHDGRAYDRGAVVAVIACACRVHGVSG